MDVQRWKWRGHCAYAAYFFNSKGRVITNHYVCLPLKLPYTCAVLLTWQKVPPSFRWFRWWYRLCWGWLHSCFTSVLDASGGWSGCSSSLSVDESCAGLLRENPARRASSGTRWLCWCGWLYWLKEMRKLHMSSLVSEARTHSVLMWT